MEPILAFPQKGIDDPAAYRGYTTRFFRDSDGNTVQVYINRNSGRVVHLWADAANESISFTVRKTDGTLTHLDWLSRGVRTDTVAGRRTVEHSLAVQAASIEIGRVLLSSMRKERDFQYFQKHVLPFDAPSFVEEELSELIGNLERLPVEERKRQLTLLNAANLDALRDRLQPLVTTSRTGAQWVVLVRQPSFNGKNELSLEIRDDSSRSSVLAGKKKITVAAKLGEHLRLTVTIGTNSASLSPLNCQEIFNDDFFHFHATVQSQRDSALHLQSAGRTSKDLTKLIARSEWLERNIKGAELLSSREKLMAGLPNYATYFGRDMMMSALMMEPIWKPAMLEHVIASVLRKLREDGNVSHEEALGGQAIKENAADYNRFMAEYFALTEKGEKKKSDERLRQARNILGNLQAIRENYHMLDDDFQLPVLTARYLSRTDVSPDRKRTFLMEHEPLRQNATRLALLFRNLRYIAELTRPYAKKPDALNLVGFPQLENGRWRSGSWRDSDAGYANGRFAMDINAIWVPKALESLRQILAIVKEVGVSPREVMKSEPALRGGVLALYVDEPSRLDEAIMTWRGAVQHFFFTIPANEVEQRIHAKLNWLENEEAEYWNTSFAHQTVPQGGLEFLALSLDENGRPIPVENTDPATWLYLGDFTSLDPRRTETPGMAQKLFKIALAPYPLGLFIDNLGPVVANDVFAPRDVWDRFKGDHYHSPRVVWGREVNLLLLGLAKQILAATTAEGSIKEAPLTEFVHEWRFSLSRIAESVGASGLKHNELWTYRIEHGSLHPTRYATSTDLQLWNVTDLAVQFMLHKLQYGRTN